MKVYLKRIFVLPLLTAGVLAFFASCNKEVEDPVPIETSAPSGQSLAQLIDGDASLSIFKAAVARAATSGASPSIATLLADQSGVFTVFAPTDAAFQAAFQMLGIPAAIGINALRPGQLDTILRYHIVGGQRVTRSMITAFPNVQLPTFFELAKPSAQLPPGLRMPVFPSSRSTFAWANNIPITAAEIQASNGVIHKVALPLLPPQQVLWARIATDPDLEYLRAAVLRADEGNPSPGLVAALSNPAASLTVFAPTDAAFQQLLTGQITLALVNMGVAPANAQAQATAWASTPDVFKNPALASVLTPTNVAGIVLYHVLGSRAFSVNLPTTATLTPTLLNRAIAAHPGVALQATFGTTGVTAATVKGAANPSASNIQINPTPAPGGTSDQHYINGVLHVIDQVLRPQ